MWLITTDKRLINNGLTVSGNTVYTLKIHRSKLADVFLSWSYLHEKAKVRKFGRFFFAMKKSNTQLWSLEQTTVFVHCDYCRVRCFL